MYSLDKKNKQMMNWLRNIGVNGSKINFYFISVKKIFNTNKTVL